MEKFQKGNQRYARGKEVDKRWEVKLSGNLPADIILDILTRLPLKSLSKFRWVCKSWFETITHTRFAHAHHTNSLQNKTSPCVLLRCLNNFALIDHQPFDYHQFSVDVVNLKLNEFQQSFRILGSVNGLVGLVCLCSLTDNSLPTTFYIFNPITRVHVILPKPPNYPNTNTVSGFGFDSISNEYKVIRIFCFTKSYTAKAVIYTLGSGTWRNIENVPYINRITSGVFANNSLHWITLESCTTEVLVIASFNLSTEEFGLIGMPPGINLSRWVKDLNVFENEICIVNFPSGDDLEIWLMDRYSVHESWSRKHVIGKHMASNTYDRVYRMMKVNNGELLLWVVYQDKEWGPSSEYLHYYEPQTRKSQPINIQSDLMFWEPFVFHGSLYSPNTIERSTSRLRPS